MGITHTTDFAAMGLPDALRARLETDLECVFIREAAERALHEAIEELRLYRDGQLNTDRLNALHGRCTAFPCGAHRHQAIIDLLIRDVLAAHALWVGVPA